ncbi:hypothetical protein PV328_006207 [Microctonus aethiopoides]|uniref:Neurite outgrowth-associated protein n=2 Tax=Microctonus aethiopoides TaxID=144406 RepID=A0AA39FNX3_9HYME|nr:hypothetical protein PV328_006207 [Microctonus aethiopoides]
MNSLKSFIFIISRGYSRRPSQYNKSYRIQKIHENMNEKQLYPDVNENELDLYDDNDDLDSAESDFSSAGKSYTQHLREEKYAKELLKMRIIKRKYFKSNDPAFVTWTEKNQIQSLHKADNVEWTPERLSESFPALPETINKILKAKWLPKSVDSVIKHDQSVVENWKKFKSGNLAVDPTLENHLKKFENRKIDIENLALNAEQFVKQPPVFPTPKSNIYRSIIEDGIENTKKKQLNNQLKIEDKISKTNNSVKELIKKDKYNDKKMVTFDAFLQDKIDTIADSKNLSLENQLLVDEYKERKNIAAIETNDLELLEDKKDKLSNAITTNELTTEIKVPRIDVNTSSIDTGILEWKKKTFKTTDDYPSFIKVPRAKAKSGVTFKVEDRYYDTDGEFLYRVPGIKV